MRAHTTWRLAIVVLLLSVASFGLGHRGTIAAASQQLKANTRVFFPIVYLRPVPQTDDLQIEHLGLYQSVQNSLNSVTLVSGKPALLRVYAKTMSTSGPSSVAEVTVRAYRNGRLLGLLTQGPRLVPTQPRADDLGSTFNFDLPHEWLSGRVVLKVAIDEVNTIAEFDENNNRRSATFTFQDVPALNVTIVPIEYTHLPNGMTYSNAAHDPVSDWLGAVFPISEVKVNLHLPYHFSGDLRQPADWERLLREITTLWSAEVGFASPHVFYGLIPTDAPSRPSWFEGGISGLGWIGQRVAIGLDLGENTGESAAHELGHNFGRRHAPCGNPSRVDPDYPYPNASIGVIGLDTGEYLLKPPSQTHDMMSYCGPEWVSDYTYEALAQDQIARGGQSSSVGFGLLLRAEVRGDAVTVLPSYTFDQPLAAAQGDGLHQVQLIDDRSQVMGTYPATLVEAEEQGVSAAMLVASLPAPGGNIASIRFLKGDVVLAEHTLSAESTQASTAAVTQSGEHVSIQWGSAQIPALVRYSVDGESWTVLASDALGGALDVASNALPSGPLHFQVVLADGGPTLTAAFR